MSSGGGEEVVIVLGFRHRLKIKLNYNNNIIKARKNNVSLINQWSLCRYYVLETN